MVKTALFLDESKDGDYILAAALVPNGRQVAFRKVMSQLRFKGAKRLHFAHEKDSQRGKVIAKLLQLDIKFVIYRVAGQREYESRALCIEGIVEDLVRHDVVRIVFESDESLISSDGRQLRTGLLERGLLESVTYDHFRPHEEPVLWAADAIAWCYSRGGDWRKLISPMVLELRDLTP